MEFSIYSILRDFKERLWVGGASIKYGLTCFENDRLVPVGTDKQDESLCFSNIRCMLEEKEGLFLLGSASGRLLRFDVNKSS